MKKYIPYILTFILGIVVCISVHKCSTNKSITIEQHMDSVKILKDKEKNKIAFIDTLQKKFKEQLIKDSLEDIEYYKQIRAVKNRLSKTKSRIDTILIKDPVLDSTLRLYDSTIVILEAKIDTLAQQKFRLIQKYDSLSTATSDKDKVTKDINDHMDMVVKQLSKENNILTTKNKLLTKWAIPIGGAIIGVGGVYLGTKLK